MALSFLFANKPKAAFDGLTLIEFDASLSESHVYTALVTQNPVESGADISDNISIKPVTLSMTGFVTDSPVKILQGLRSSLSGSGSRSKTAHDDLVTLFKSKKTFTVITGLSTYTDMVLRSLTFPRTAIIGQAIQFQADLIQITLANFETSEDDSTLGNRNESKEQARKKKDLGKQQATESTASEKNQGSLLYNAIFN